MSTRQTEANTQFANQFNSLEFERGIFVSYLIVTGIAIPIRNKNGKINCPFIPNFKNHQSCSKSSRWYSLFLNTVS